MADRRPRTNDQRASVQSRRWMVTIWPDRLPAEWDAKDVDEDVTYMAWQLEKAPDTGREHYQMYVETRRKITMRGLAGKMELPSGSYHMEKARGSSDECTKYCTKEDTRAAGPWTRGNPMGRQGERTDLEAYRDAVIEGRDDRHLLENYPAIVARYPKFSEHIRNIAVRAQRDRKPMVTVVYGPTGTGKSHWARTSDDDIYYHSFGDGNRWWDGYTQQHRVVFDDFGGFRSGIPISLLLVWLDKYPCTVQVRYGTVPLNSPEIVFTSNFHPDEWYPNADVRQRDALMRRLDNIVLMDKPYNQGNPT